MRKKKIKILHAYNGLRQYIAVSICFYAMKYILNKDAKRYLLAVLIAFLFHKSLSLAKEKSLSQ